MAQLIHSEESGWVSGLAIAQMHSSPGWLARRARSARAIAAAQRRVMQRNAVRCSAVEGSVVERSAVQGTGNPPIDSFCGERVGMRSTTQNSQVAPDLRAPSPANPLLSRAR